MKKPKSYSRVVLRLMYVDALILGIFIGLVASGIKQHIPAASKIVLVIYLIWTIGLFAWFYRSEKRKIIRESLEDPAKVISMNNQTII